MGPRPFGRGNSSSGVTSGMSGNLFNGAAAFRSRKLPLPSFLVRAGQVSSMGPRPFGRGNPTVAPGPRAAREIFNGAAAFRSRKCHKWGPWVSVDPTLQWGRGLSVAEIRPIRPIRTIRRRLQWGRGLSVAEMVAQARHPEKSQNLQWGRGLSVAEMGFRRRPLPRSATFFNGAAAFRSRKCPITVRPLREENALQWGRGLSVAEIA